MKKKIVIFVTGVLGLFLLGVIGSASNNPSKPKVAGEKTVEEVKGEIRERSDGVEEAKEEKEVVTERERQINDYYKQLLSQYEEELYERYDQPTGEQLQSYEDMATRDTAVKFGISEDEVIEIFMKLLTAKTTAGRENKTVWEKGKAEIESTIRNILGEKTNLGKEKLRVVSINAPDIENTQYVVFVQFNADDNAFGEDSIRDGIYKEMTELYRAFFDQRQNVVRAIIDAYFPFEDKYGHSSDILVYGTELTRQEAQKVNWESDLAHLAFTVLPQVWEVTNNSFD